MRLNILQRDNFTCQICESNTKTLHVHHKYYIWDQDPWDYSEETLITLCEDCHQKEGFGKDDMNTMIRQLLNQGKTYNDICQQLVYLFD